MKTIAATFFVVLSCTGAWADELNDMPDIACAQASSALEREHIGCPGTTTATAKPRADASPASRTKDH